MNAGGDLGPNPKRLQAAWGQVPFYSTPPEGLGSGGLRGAPQVSSSPPCRRGWSFVVPGACAEGSAASRQRGWGGGLGLQAEVSFTWRGGSGICGPQSGLCPPALPQSCRGEGRGEGLSFPHPAASGSPPPLPPASPMVQEVPSPHQLVVLGKTLRPAGGSRLDLQKSPQGGTVRVCGGRATPPAGAHLPPAPHLSCAEPHDQVSNEGVLCLP